MILHHGSVRISRMDPAITERIVQEVALSESSVTAVLELFRSGAAAPFIVRYRKEATGGLDESAVRTIQDRMVYYQELEQRRAQLVKLSANKAS